MPTIAIDTGGGQWKRPSAASPLMNAIEVAREGSYVLLRGSQAPMVQFVLTIDEWTEFKAAIIKGEMEL